VRRKLGKMSRGKEGERGPSTTCIVEALGPHLQLQEGEEENRRQTNVLHTESYVIIGHTIPRIQKIVCALSSRSVLCDRKIIPVMNQCTARSRIEQ
jgi:hypothetical protein